VDSDLFDSRTNMQGWVVGGNYALGAATQFSLTLAQAQRKNDTIIASGAGDVGTNNALNKFWLLQADLNIKF
jgi:prolyl-tRNA editing enzyme YbaK/EbsC (Cys-tRNA(Pro) deacylase)